MRSPFISTGLAASLAATVLGASIAGAKETGVPRQQRLTPQVSSQVQPNAATTSSSNVLLFQYRVGNYVNTTTNTPVAVPITNAQGTSATFKTTNSNQLVIVSYNAECGALGTAGDEDYLSIEILIDGKQIVPNSGEGFAFCTATGSSYTWVAATRQSATHVTSPGTHTVQVMGIGEYTTAWWLGDSSLTIFNGD